MGSYDQGSIPSIAEAIQSASGLVGPSDGDTVRLLRWVAVAGWVDLATGETVLSRFGSDGLLTHERVGLLHEGLYGFNDEL